MAVLFISYASLDGSFARRLADGLNLLGHMVWLDQCEIAVGDSLVGKVSEGIERAEYVLVVLSRHTASSSWVEHEWQMKYHEEVTKRRPVLLPLLLEECVIPFFLRHKRFADFRTRHEVGFAQLALTLERASAAEPHQVSDAPSFSDGYRRPSPTTDSTCYTLDMGSFPPYFSEISIELGVPYLGKISGLWKPDADEQAAAWELYIELVTRVSITGLQPGEGSLREALSSMYAIFTIARDLLHKYGPSVARLKSGSDVSFGYLAIAILNYALRPVLAKWHPLLQEYEQSREATRPALEHERRWERSEELRLALQETQQVLRNYASILAQVAGIPELYR